MGSWRITAKDSPIITLDGGQIRGSVRGGFPGLKPPVFLYQLVKFSCLVISVTFKPI